MSDDPKIAELTDELRIANERGDAWREQVKEDTLRHEAIRSLCTEWEDQSPECARLAELIRTVLTEGKQ